MAVTVIVDVFSGQPNPHWTLAADVVVQLKLLLAQLAHAHGGHFPEPPGLGYRGILLEFSSDEGVAGSLRVFGGYVLGPHEAWIDSGRALERWLLQTGRGAIDENLLKSLLDMIR
jgi:hypothetical protein